MITSSYDWSLNLRDCLTRPKKTLYHTPPEAILYTVFRVAAAVDYIGKTISKLEIRIGEQEPASLASGKDDDSAIALHLANNPECLRKYFRQRFTVLSYARNDY